MSPLIMSHINRTRPQQGLQLVIRRVAGSQISHIFRRASAGSEALPSLARRVSMQQHAELPCRGNISTTWLPFDVARRFAQPLGIHLDAWEGRCIETEKGIVRLVPVLDRAEQLFGEDGAGVVADSLENTAPARPDPGDLFPPR